MQQNKQKNDENKIKIEPVGVLIGIIFLIIYGIITVYVINCMVIGDCGIGAGVIAFLNSIPLIISIILIIFASSK